MYPCYSYTYTLKCIFLSTATQSPLTDVHTHTHTHTHTLPSVIKWDSALGNNVSIWFFKYVSFDRISLLFFFLYKSYNVQFYLKSFLNYLRHHDLYEAHRSLLLHIKHSLCYFPNFCFNFIFMYILFIFPKYNMCSMKIRQKDLKLKPVFIVEVKYILKLDFIF